MKKLFFMFLVGMFLIGIGGQVYSDNYSVVLSSYDITSTTTQFAAAYPNITGGCRIDKLTFATTNTISTPVLIKAWDTATSTTAATLDGYWVLTSSGNPAGNTLEVDYPYHNPLIYTSPAFSSNIASGTIKIYMNVIYR